MESVREMSNRSNLSGIFSDLFILGTHVRNTKDLGYADSLRKRIIEMFDSAEKKGKDWGFSNEMLSQAKYALAAFLDEMIMSSPWPEKDQWSANLLQYEFFKESIAGTEFFNKIDSVRRAYPINVELLEVFYLCLILGFEGQYKIRGKEQLKELVEAVARELQPKKGKKAVLSPHGERPDEIIEVVKRGLPSWVMVVSSVGIVFFFYLTLSFLMSSHTNRVIEQIEAKMEVVR